MSARFLRDVIDAAVKIWSILFFSSAMVKRKKSWGLRIGAMCLMALFVLGQRYVLNRNTLSEALVRNILLYLLTCFVMLAWRKGQTQYLIFLASIVFFLWGGWLKLFTPVVFASLHLPTFGYSIHDAFPLIPVTIAENVCRVLIILWMRTYTFDISPDRQITAKEAFLALVPAIIDHTTVLILYYLTIIAPSSQAESISREMTMLTLMLVFGMPCILAATEKQFQLQREKVKLLQMESQMRQQVQEFENKRISDEQARRIYHDMSKHLHVLEGMMDGSKNLGAANEYLSDMLRAADTVTPQVHTGNAVLDTLLEQKQAECREKEILLECMVDFSGAAFIRYADVVTMFANAVDNAIDAVQTLPVEKRRISLGAGMIGGQIIVKCENPYEGMRRKRQDGLFASSKQNSMLHGIGLSNLKRIVELYQGVLQIDDRNGIFQVEWMIPVPVEG
ncbi:MAG: GHKL domain-containing protein [Clostridia bacterium]|nr:GHKL domain-containing protein [Clostridia bacterium]